LSRGAEEYEFPAKDYQLDPSAPGRRPDHHLVDRAGGFRGTGFESLPALGKMSKNAGLNKFCSAYIFFFRGTPLLMQLYFIYYGLPEISRFLTINNRFIAAFIAFGLNSAAYCAEIIRAAIQSIDKGQFEASRALGLSYAQTMRLVIIPQSIRRLIPPVGNEFIMVLKDASLVSIIALADITKVTRSISSSSATALVYIPAMILYLIITAVFSFIFHKLEKKYSVYQ
jgi:polar amino acid transport system permease protein